MAKNENQSDGGWQAPVAEKSYKRSYQASFVELYLFGVLVLGKGLTFWQSGFIMGYWEFFFCVGMVALAYICFTSCVAEMTSILPFSGGSYGYVRCVLGPFMGYMVGFFESMEYTIFVSASLVAFGNIMTLACQTDEWLEPVYWLFFYAFAIPFQIIGGSVFWKVGGLMALWILLIILIYCFGNVGVASMAAEVQFHPEPMVFLRYFAVAGWCFKGIEVMTLTCEDTPNPSVRVPKAMMMSIGSMIVLVLSIVVIMGSIQPGPAHLVSTKFPLSPGLTRLFHLEERYVALLFAPGILGSTYCFLFASSKQLFAMASSGLVPSWLKRTYGPNQSPLTALLVVSLTSYIVEVILFYTRHQTYLSILFTISMMSSLPVYVSLMVAYCIYSVKFSNMERQFRSPLGKLGACYAISLYGFAAVTLIVFPKEVTVSTTFFAVSTVLTIIYYFLVAQKKQCFSNEEQARFFKVYIANLSRRTRRNRRSGKRGLKGVLVSLLRGPNLAVVYLTSSRSGGSMLEDRSGESSLRTGVATRGDVGDTEECASFYDDSLCRVDPVPSLKEGMRQLSFPLDSTGHSTGASRVVRLSSDLERSYSHVCPVDGRQCFPHQSSSSSSYHLESMERKYT